MARPPRQSSSPGMSAGQSAYVLEKLIAERRVSPGDVNRIIADMGREISDLELQLQRLRAAHGGSSSSAAAAPAPARRGPGRPPGRPGRPPGKRRGRPPASAAPAAAPAAAEPAAKGGVKRRKRRKAITPEQLASRQLQGRYLALVRQFAATRRPQYAKIAKEKGREAAIREMQANLKK